MKKMILLSLLLVACSDTDVISDACPDGVTRIGGDRVDCTTDDGALGVCVETPAGATCAARCTETGGPLCPQPGFWYSLPLDGESICFCFDPNTGTP